MIPTAEPGPPRPPHPDPILLVWIGGAVLAVVAYAIGPDQVIGAVLGGIERALWELRNIAHHLTEAGFEAMRALAIGLLGVFIALSLLSIHRTGRGHGGMIMLTIAFLVLIWGAGPGSTGGSIRWLIALFLAGAGALSATNRLRYPSSPGWRMPGRTR